MFTCGVDRLTATHPPREFDESLLPVLKLACTRKEGYRPHLRRALPRSAHTPKQGATALVYDGRERSCWDTDECCRRYTGG